MTGGDWNLLNLEFRSHWTSTSRASSESRICLRYRFPPSSRCYIKTTMSQLTSYRVISPTSTGSPRVMLKTLSSIPYGLFQAYFPLVHTRVVTTSVQGLLFGLEPFRLSLTVIVLSLPISSARLHARREVDFHHLAFNTARRFFSCTRPGNVFTAPF